MAHPASRPDSEPAPSPSPSPSPQPEPSNIVVLRGASWADYERLLDVRGEHRVPRIHYLDGVLELMSPSRFHEGLKGVIGCLVECWCLENDVDFTTVGSWTLKDKVAKAGAEPDECYVFGMEGPTDGGRPDLAIEVVWSHGGLSKLETYRRRKVREVWFWRGGTLSLHVLRGDQYELIGASEVLPELDLGLLQRFMHLRPTSRAIRAYRDALRA